jgi:hypothetical protein
VNIISPLDLFFVKLPLTDTQVENTSLLAVVPAFFLGKILTAKPAL